MFYLKPAGDLSENRELPEIPEIEEYLVEDEENDLIMQGDDNLAIDYEPETENETLDEENNIDEVNVGEENTGRSASPRLSAI